MQQQIQLSVSVRDRQGKGGARKIRASGKVPGIVYGKGVKNILVEADPKELEKAFSSSAGTNALLQLKVSGKNSFTAMLKDYQADILTRRFTHLDFVTIDLTQKIRVEVPLQIIGKPEGVKEGGILEVIRRELSVTCLPTGIPQNIEVDVSSLKIGQSIHLNDIRLPEGIEVPQDINFVLVSVVAPQAEEVAPVAPVEGAPTEPEVLTAKKPTEGEEGTAPAGGEKKGEKKAEPKAEGKGEKK